MSNAEKKEILAEALKSPGYLLNPEDEIMQKWDIVMVVLLMYVVIVTPFEVALLEPSFNLPSGRSTWSWHRLLRT